VMRILSIQWIKVQESFEELPASSIIDSPSDQPWCFQLRPTVQFGIAV
jgi:hypothetical protein